MIRFEIVWGDRLVNIEVNRQKVEDGSAYDASVTIDHAFDKKYLTYFGIKLVDS